jgi:hypothetical protein
MRSVWSWKLFVKQHDSRVIYGLLLTLINNFSGCNHKLSLHFLDSLWRGWSSTIFSEKKKQEYSMNFFYSHSGGGGGGTLSTRHIGPWMAYYTCPGWLWWWRFWWNEDCQGRLKYSEKTCPSATLSTTNPTCQTRARTQAAAVGSQRVTAWAMARPLCDTEGYRSTDIAVTSVWSVELRKWKRNNWLRSFVYTSR